MQQRQDTGQPVSAWSNQQIRQTWIENSKGQKIDPIEDKVLIGKAEKAGRKYPMRSLSP